MNKFVYRTGSDNFGQTRIENIFINEFMAEANGNYIKVYLYGLKNSQNPEIGEMSTGEIAKRLGLTESDVLNAWQYWEDLGIIKRTPKKDHNEIAFLNITESLYHTRSFNTDEPKNDEKIYEDLITEIQTCFKGRTIPYKWNENISKWYFTYGMEPAAILYALEQTHEKLSGKDASLESQLKYMSSILENWHKKKIVTYQQALDHTESVRRQNEIIYGVLNKLGIKGRNPMARERKIINRWTDEYGFDKDMIFEAAERSREPNVEYVNGILKRWYESGWKSPDEIVDQTPKQKKDSNKSALFEPVTEERAQAIDQYEEDLFASYKDLIEKIDFEDSE